MAPTFSDFFHELWGYLPFPWQAKLAEQVLAGDDAESGWPDTLDLPTGSGKTAALDVALYCLAMAPHKMPRRCILVVDRRIVVDQAADRLREIQAKVAQAEAGPLKEIATRLRDLSREPEDEHRGPPFDVAVMRGGMPRDNDWARRPDLPVFGASTVDQVGSRILFRGYGVRNLSASIHAGLLANDTLILLDEVHLAVPFAQTLKAIGAHYLKRIEGVPARFKVVCMSATVLKDEEHEGKSPENAPFGLGEKDLADPELQRRLNARKRAELKLVTVSGDSEEKKLASFAKHAADRALDLRKDGAKVIAVVVNRVDTAREVHRTLLEKGEASLLLMTGRMRPIDRDDLLGAHLDALIKRTKDREPLVVISTQCIEAGADFDFDALVTECASLDALRQRFGRLDRKGAMPDGSDKIRAYVLCRKDAANNTDDPVYGGALAETWKWLESKSEKKVIDFGITKLKTLLPTDREQLGPMVMEGKSAPLLMPSHLDAWAQTSPTAYFAPDIAMFLHGAERTSADVQVVWRSEVVIPQAGANEKQLKQLAMVTSSRLSLRRPSSLEAMSLPLGAAKRWLAGAIPPPIADTIASETDTGDDDRLKDKDTVVALRWSGEDSRFVTLPEIRPGDVLVLPLERGGVAAAAGNFDPNSRSPVEDLGDIAQLLARKRASLTLSARALATWHPNADPKSIPQLDEEELARETRERLVTFLRGLGEPSASPEDAEPHRTENRRKAWREILEALDRTRPLPKVQWLEAEGENPGYFLITTRTIEREGALKERHAETVDEQYTEGDEGSFVALAKGDGASLKGHSVRVRHYAKHFASKVGLPAHLENAISLAAWFHDVGKADPRFQRWLLGGAELPGDENFTLLAKSKTSSTLKERRAARVRAGYPRDYRHELLSLAMLEGAPQALPDDETLRDLVLHLVASHHGWCRPFAPMVVDRSEGDEVVWKHEDVNTMVMTLRAAPQHRYARLDGGVSDRFWRLNQKYGYWGLAWFEAILRLADHAASAELEQA